MGMVERLEPVFKLLRLASDCTGCLDCDLPFCASDLEICKQGEGVDQGPVLGRARGQTMLTYAMTIVGASLDLGERRYRAPSPIAAPSSRPSA